MTQSQDLATLAYTVRQQLVKRFPSVQPSMEDVDRAIGNAMRKAGLDLTVHERDAVEGRVWADLAAIYTE